MQTVKKTQIDPQDPRLIQLLNLLAYSYDQSMDSYTQGAVKDSIVGEYLSMSSTRLEITFREDAVSEEGVSYFSGKQAVICANAYMLIHSNNEISEMYHTLRCEYVRYPFYEAIGEASASWEEDKWIDLLEAVGF